MLRGRPRRRRPAAPGRSRPRRADGAGRRSWTRPTHGSRPWSTTSSAIAPDGRGRRDRRRVDRRLAHLPRRPGGLRRRAPQRSRGPAARDGQGPRAGHRVHRRLRGRQPHARLRHPDRRLDRQSSAVDGRRATILRGARIDVECRGASSTGTQRSALRLVVAVTAAAPGGRQHEVAHVEVQVVGLAAPARRGTCGRRGRRPASAPGAPSMPVSSSASRSATRARLPSPSACPPGCSQRCTLAWKRSRTWRVLGSTTAAEPVRWPSRHDRWSASGWSSMKARIRRRFASCVGLARARREHRGSGRGQVRRRRRARPDVCSALMPASTGGASRGCTSATGARCRPTGRSACVTAGAVGRRRAVVDDRHAAVGGDEVGAVVGAVEAEGLAQAGRTGRAGRGRAAPWRRRARISSSPATGSAARSSTATPSPSRPHTALAHQCMP